MNAPQLQFMQPAPEPSATRTLAALEADLRVRAAWDQDQPRAESIPPPPPPPPPPPWRGSSCLAARARARLPARFAATCRPRSMTALDGEESALQARSAEATYTQLAAVPYVTKETLDSAFERPLRGDGRLAARATVRVVVIDARAERRRLDGLRPWTISTLRTGAPPRLWDLYPVAGRSDVFGAKPAGQTRSPLPSGGMPSMRGRARRLYACSKRGFYIV